MVSFCVSLVSRLVQLERRVRSQVEGHVRVKLVGEVCLVAGVVADVADQCGASELIDLVVFRRQFLAMGCL